MVTSTNLVKLERVCREIKDIAEKTGTKILGPVPLPVKRMVLPARKPSSGEGTNTWYKRKVYVHRRLIDLEITDQRVMRQIMRIQVPDDVAIEMALSSQSSNTADRYNR